MTESANDRFKRRSARGWWIAGFIAVALHVGILLANPGLDVNWSIIPADRHPFALRASSLLVPVFAREDTAGTYVPLDSLDAVPRVVNLERVFARLASYWTGELWAYREQGGAVFQLWIDEEGAVKEAMLVEHDNPAKTEALSELVRQLRFEPGVLRGERTGCIAVIRLAVEVNDDMTPSPAFRPVRTRPHGTAMQVHGPVQ